MADQVPLKRQEFVSAFQSLPDSTVFKTLCLIGRTLILGDTVSTFACTASSSYGSSRAAEPMLPPPR